MLVPLRGAFATALAVVAEAGAVRPRPQEQGVEARAPRRSGGEDAAVAAPEGDDQGHYRTGDRRTARVLSPAPSTAAGRSGRRRTVMMLVTARRMGRSAETSGEADSSAMVTVRMLGS